LGIEPWRQNLPTYDSPKVGQRRKLETGRVSLPTVEQVVTTFLLKAHV